MPSAAASVLALVMLLQGCSGTPSDSQDIGSETMELTSPAFSDGGRIPPEHTCDGADTSPPLEWSGVPGGTVSFALLVTDPDAGGFAHWVLVDIAAEASGLSLGEGDAAGTSGRNGFGRIGWGGPCPPSGEHRYVFTLYALDEPLGLTGTPDPALVQSALQGRVLAEASLTAAYARDR